jgi:hypothetical protein
MPCVRPWLFAFLHGATNWQWSQTMLGLGHASSNGRGLRTRPLMQIGSQAGGGQCALGPSRRGHSPVSRESHGGGSALKSSVGPGWQAT